MKRIYLAIILVLVCGLTGKWNSIDLVNELLEFLPLIIIIGQRGFFGMTEELLVVGLTVQVLLESV